MSPPDAYKPAKPEMVTTTGVTVFVSGLYRTYPGEDAEPPASDPFPTAIVFPAGQEPRGPERVHQGAREAVGPVHR